MSVQSGAMKFIVTYFSRSPFSYFSCVVVACCVFSSMCQSQHGGVNIFQPPVLNVKGAYYDIPVNSTLLLQCEGRYPLKWEVPEHWKDVILESANITTSFNKRQLQQYQYFSQLEILYADPHFTGRYTCYYEGTTRFELASNVTSIYVFVNDPTVFFVELPVVGHHAVVTVRQAVKGILPCLPTYSSMNMTLWKKEGDDELVPLEKGLDFDPTQGFIIHYPYSFFNGLFYCQGELDNQTKQFFLTLFFLSETVSAPVPTVEGTDIDFVTVNGSFELKCSVRVGHGVRVYIDWIYPNQNNTHIIQLPHKTEEAKTGRNFVFTIVSRILVVKNVQKSDEGTYICNVTDHSSKTNQQDIYITVYDQAPDDFLNITTDIDTSKPFEQDVGNEVQIIMTVFAQPRLQDVLHIWKKDGKFIQIDGVRYSERSLGQSRQLTISKSELSDSGVYTLLAELGKEQANLSVTLQIRAKPTVSITNHQNFFILDHKYSIECVADGYPLGQVWWIWKPCPTMKNCGIDSIHGWTEVDGVSSMPNNDTFSLDALNKLSYRRVLKLNVIAHESGIYRCYAKNSLGQNESTIIFKVSDAVEGFDVKEKVTKPVEGDQVNLTCRANVYNFTNLKWFWQPENDTIMPVKNRSDHNLILFTSNFSHLLALRIENITKEDSGNYICSAWHEDTPQLSQNISRPLHVQRIVHPTILTTNMDDKEITVDQTQEVKFFCNVSGIPPPVITWWKDGSVFDATNKSGIELTNGNTTLLIKRVMESDEGIYMCQATNRGGVVSRITSLSVVGDQTMPEPDAGLSTGDVTLIVVMIVFGIGLFITAFFLCKKLYQDKKHKKDLEFINHALFDRGQVEMFNPDLPLEEQAELLPYDHHWEFPKDRLKLGKTLGQGAFGRVVKAEAIGLEDGETSTTVAVKMLKERANVDHQKALMAELKILIHLGRHLNIVNLLGAVTKNIARGELMVIVEYCRFGNLRHYLLCQRDKFINQLNPATGQIDPNICALPLSPGSHKDFPPVFQRSGTNPGITNPVYRDQSVRYAELLSYRRSTSASESYPHHPSVSTDSTDMTGTYSNSSFRNRHGSICYRGETKDIPVSTCDLICYAFQCARGMEYLAARKLIHRDLAARNVLLAEDNIVKICDFGLAKDCYKYSNYVKKGNGPLPIKWMAIESIRDKVFTIKSDVWSFGVLLWEMFTLGGNPYPGVEMNEEFYKRLKEGYRMEKPELAPDIIYDIMQEAWRADPKDRPEFSELVEKIGNLLEEGVRKYYIDLNGPYSVMNEMSNNNDYLKMDGKSGDYMNMKAERENSPGAISDEQQVDGLLDNKDNPQAHYKNIGAIRPVGDGPVPTVPMEVVPMIQLETYNNKWGDDPEDRKGKAKGPPPLLSPVAFENHSDYLLMNSPQSEKEQQEEGKGAFSSRSPNSNNDFTYDGISPPPPYNLVIDPHSRFPVFKV